MSEHALPGRPAGGLLVGGSGEALLGRIQQQFTNACGAAASMLIDEPVASELPRVRHAVRLHAAGPPMTAAGYHALRSHATERVESTARLAAFAPELESFIRSPFVAVLPVTWDSASSLLIMLFDRDPGDAWSAQAPLAAATLGLAIAWLHVQRVTEFQSRVREVGVEVGRTLSSTLNRGASLTRMCHALAPVFGAARAAAWIHDRRARELVMEGASDPEAAIRAARLPIGDPAPIALALRADAPQIISAETVKTLLIPLRGRRRSLGVIAIEGVRLDLPEQALMDASIELARHLGSAIENTQLFEDVLRSRRELQDAFNSLADLVFVCDRQHRLLNSNRAFRDRLLPSHAQPVDRPIRDVVGRELADWISRLDLASAAAEGFHTELDDPVLNGRFSVRATPLASETAGRPVGLVVVARDISEQTRLEAERRDLRERLVQSEKLAALGQFVAGVAHELNNPLTGVLGHLELLRKTRRVPRPLEAELRHVYREAERAARIINNLLVFAGSRKPAQRRLSLASIVARTVALRSAACRREGIRIVREYDQQLPRVRGDSLLLQQALLNVLLNAEQAIAAGPGSGVITVVTRQLDEHSVAVEIHDSGPGIPDAVLPRIFEPFFTTKEVGKGTGLGLALAYGIVQEHGGRISARNGESGGAVFRVELPADRADTMDARP